MHHIRNYQRHGAEVGSHVIRLNMFLDFDMDLVVISIFMSSQLSMIVTALSASRSIIPLILT
jgi:hypothetical protein